MKITIPDLGKFTPVLLKIRKYSVFSALILFLLIYSFLVFRINQLTGEEPSDEAVKEKLQTVQRPVIDQASLNKIQELEAQNVDVKTLFKEARENPFSE